MRPPSILKKCELCNSYYKICNTNESNLSTFNSYFSTIRKNKQ